MIIRYVVVVGCDGCGATVEVPYHPAETVAIRGALERCGWAVGGDRGDLCPSCVQHDRVV